VAKLGIVIREVAFVLLLFLLGIWLTYIIIGNRLSDKIVANTPIKFLGVNLSINKKINIGTILGGNILYSLFYSFIYLPLSYEDASDFAFAFIYYVLLSIYILIAVKLIDKKPKAGFRMVKVFVWFSILLDIIILLAPLAKEYIPEYLYGIAIADLLIMCLLLLVTNRTFKAVKVLIKMD
jgi:hypothetical protein